MNRSGRVTDGAWASARAARLAGRRQGFSVRDGLSPADGGDKTSVMLFLGFTDEAALFQQGIEMQRPAIGVRADPGARRQVRDRLQDDDQRLWRFETAR